MKRRIKQKSGVYAYLDSIKVLESGNEAAIAHARNEYWKIYRANWRRKQRQNTSQLTIAFTSAELSIIAQAAKTHGESKTSMVKKACLAYFRKTYIAPDKVAVRSILQLLAMNYNTLRHLFDENRLTFRDGKQFLFQMEQLEANINKILSNPKTIEQWIEEVVKSSPHHKEIFIQLLNSLSDDN